MKLKHRYWRFEEGILRWCQARFQLPREEVPWSSGEEYRELGLGWEWNPFKYRAQRKMTLGDQFKWLLARVFEPSSKRWDRRFGIDPSKRLTREEIDALEARIKEWEKIVKGESNG